jgi:hypothetical protein
VSGYSLQLVHCQRGIRWKDRIDGDVAKLTARMDRLTQRLSVNEFPIQNQDSRRASGSESGSGLSTVNAVTPHWPVLSSQIEMDGGIGGSWNDDAVEDSGLAAIPASVVSEVTRHSPTARPSKRAKHRYHFSWCSDSGTSRASVQLLHEQARQLHL